jgi:hypothetical protein
MTTTTRVEIEIPEVLVRWRRFGARLEGVTPLLMHNPRNLMQSGQGVGRKEVPPPEKEAEAGLYRLADGRLYIPADNVRECMLRGAIGLRTGRKALKPIIAAAVMVDEPAFILQRNGEPLLNHDVIDLRRVVVQKAGVIRARGMVDTPWQLDITFVFDEEVIKAEAIIQALQRAGQVVGVLDYRPERGGVFGRFSVTSAWIEET